MYSLLTFSDIMKNAGGVLAAVAVLLAMVTIHEFGHYLAGKILGFKINEFSVGFGPAIFKKRSKKTGELFALRVVPLGGYCAFDGEDDADEETEKSNEDKKNAADEPFAEMAETAKKQARYGQKRSLKRIRRKAEKKARAAIPNRKASVSTISRPGSALSCFLRGLR